jgi:hypothetical protein
VEIAERKWKQKVKAVEEIVDPSSILVCNGKWCYKKNKKEKDDKSLV